MSFKEKIYEKMPIVVQNILISMYGLKLIMERYGRVYREYKKELKSKNYSDYSICLKEQEREFLDFINYAYKNSKFYKKLYKDININEIKSLNNIKKLPIVTKEMLRENMNEIRTIDLHHAIEGHTGGTTGKSLIVYFTKEDSQKRMAYLDNFREMHGAKHRMRRATFSGKNIIPSKDENKNIFWRDNIFLKQRLYSTFHLSEKNLKYYVENLNSFKPQIIDGFFSSVYDLAKYIKDNCIKLNFKPIVFFPTSETIIGYQKEIIKKVFKCQVTDQYASSEGAPFITECKKGKLHYNMNTGVIEIIDNSIEGEILVTSFATHGTPLIRYRIGDVIKFSNEKCDCGSAHPVVERIDGREVDFLYSRDRGKINLGNLANVVKNVPNAIRQVQFIQDKIDEIIIKLVVDKNIYKDKYDKDLMDEMKYRFGNNVKFVIKKVDFIGREKSGKYRFIKNNLKIEELV